MKKVIAALIAFAAIALPQSESAIAEFRGYSELNSSGRRRFIFEGMLPSSVATINLGMWFFDKVYTPNSCGLVVIKTRANQSFRVVTNASQSNMGIPFSSMGFPELPTQSIPTCSPNGQLSEGRTQPFKSPEGWIVLVNQTPSLPLALRVMVNQETTVKTNQCGIGKVLSPKENTSLGAYSWEMSGFQFGAENYTGEQIMTNTPPPICKKVGNSYVIYRKAP